MRNYTTTITVKSDSTLYTALLPEIESSKWERSSYVIKRKGEELIITIIAEDIGALRASFNSITKLIAVHDKIQDLENND
jgi:tRNA threonylcarbamoyladenosine modification (KEOPS) complex  Pcc1 subunit